MRKIYELDDLDGVKDLRETGIGHDNSLRYRDLEGTKMLIRINDNFEKVFYQYLEGKGFGRIRETSLINYGDPDIGVYLGFTVDGETYYISDLDTVDN